MMSKIKRVSIPHSEIYYKIAHELRTKGTISSDEYDSIRDDQYISWYDESIDSVQRKFQRMRNVVDAIALYKDWPDLDLLITIDEDYEGDPILVFRWDRSETEQEYEARVAKETKQQEESKKKAASAEERAKQKEYEQYLKLKEKFEKVE